MVADQHGSSFTAFDCDDEKPWMRKDQFDLLTHAQQISAIS